MLSLQWHKSDIKKALEAQVGGDHRSFERILARAREVLAGCVAQDAQERLQDAVALFNRVIRDPKTTAREKLAAQEQKTKMFGIGLPYGQHDDSHSDPPTADEIKSGVIAARAALFNTDDPPDAAGYAGQPGPVQGDTGGATIGQDGMGEADPD